MKNFSAIRSYGLLGILLLLGTGAAQGQSFGADKLKCEQETDPIGIETQTPRFSWQLYAPTRGAVQTAYQIIVSDTPEAVERGTGNVWDSKKIASSQSLLVPYAGEPLEAAKKYYWSVRVWDVPVGAHRIFRNGTAIAGRLVGSTVDRIRTRHRQPDGDRRIGTPPAGDRPLQTAANAARISGEQAGAPRDGLRLRARSVRTVPQRRQDRRSFSGPGLDEIR